MYFNEYIYRDQNSVTAAMTMTVIRDTKSGKREKQSVMQSKTHKLKNSINNISPASAHRLLPYTTPSGLRIGTI